MESVFDEDKIQSWLAISGFIFPRSIEEITIFGKLYKDYQFQNHPTMIDPAKILHMTSPMKKKVDSKITLSQLQLGIDEGLKMAARGKTDIPTEILEKMKKNQKNHDDLQ